MSTRQLTVLWALRIYGPISTSGLMQCTGLTRQGVHDQLAVHLDHGNVLEVREGVYDVTAEGRLVAAAAMEASRTQVAEQAVKRSWRERWSRT
jgi:hypothetical protein